MATTPQPTKSVSKSDMTSNVSDRASLYSFIIGILVLSAQNLLMYCDVKYCVAERNAAHPAVLKPPDAKRT